MRGLIIFVIKTIIATIQEALEAAWSLVAAPVTVVRIKLWKITNFILGLLSSVLNLFGHYLEVFLYPIFKFYVATKKAIILSVAMLGSGFLWTIEVFAEFLNSCRLYILENFDLPPAFFKMLAYYGNIIAWILDSIMLVVAQLLHILTLVIPFFYSSCLNPFLHSYIGVQVFVVIAMVFTYFATEKEEAAMTTILLFFAFLIWYFYWQGIYTGDHPSFPGYSKHAFYDIPMITTRWTVRSLSICGNFIFHMLYFYLPVTIVAVYVWEDYVREEPIYDADNKIVLSSDKPLIFALGSILLVMLSGIR